MTLSTGNLPGLFAVIGSESLWGGRKLQVKGNACEISLEISPVTDVLRRGQNPILHLSRLPVPVFDIHN